MRIPGRVAAGLALSALASLGPGAALAASFFASDGFEDDVDLIVAPNQEFLVVPVENESGSVAFLDLYDLDAPGGAVVARTTHLAVAGWENGVDPVVVTVGGNQVLIAPVETESGGAAELRLFRVNADGSIAAGVTIALGDLGFEDDVDLVTVVYGGAGAIVPLERENGSAAGVLAVKLDAADFGRCTLVATVATATACDDRPEPTGRLTGFVDGVDGLPLSLADRARFAVPMQPGGAGGTGDLVFFDFDFNVPAGTPPGYIGSLSVKAVNAAGPRPLPFPGFERDVDLAEIPPSCMAGNHPLLVPVEDAAGGDLYLVEGGIGGSPGTALWRYALDSPAGPPILGYEEGADLVPWCNLGGDPDDLVAVPIEDDTGTDADLLLVGLADGALHAGLEDANPGLVVLGYEKGVEPLLWSAASLVVPLDDEHGRGRLLSVGADAVVDDAVDITGFERSVDPLTMPLGHPDRTLYVPVEKQDQSDADLLIFAGPGPLFGPATSFEASNPGYLVAGYERGVDPARVEKASGYGWLYVPEERPSDHAARLRAQDLPPGATALLAVPVEGSGATPPTNLYFVRPDGTLSGPDHPDVYGYELGLDPVANIGDTLAANPPAIAPPPLGTDADTDNTLTMQRSYGGNVDGDALGDAADCAPLEGNVWGPPGEVTDLREAKTPTDRTTISWSSQDADVGSDTVYDLLTGELEALRADGDYSASWCLADDRGDTPYTDDQSPAEGTGYYHLVRAQNVCGTGTYGPPAADVPAGCP